MTSSSHLQLLAALVIASTLGACDVQTYADAVASIQNNNPPPPAPPPAPPPEPPPPPPPGASFGATFSEIQAGLFTPTCASSSCHGGGNPAAGLNLEAASSHANLVGIPSTQDAGILRVNAGNPNASYLIQKMEGTAASGEVMPPSGSIAQADIDVVREWISAGAVDDTIVVQNPIQVTSLTPAPNANLTAAPAQIIAGFSRDLDVSTVNALTFTLFASGGDGNFNSGNETQITAATITVPGGNQASAIFDLTGVTLADDTYEVTLHGDGASVVMDLDANALDGEFSNFPSGNGAAGGDFVARFSITTPVMLGPTLDQIQAVIFTPICSSCHAGAGSSSGILDMDLRNADAAFNTLVGITSAQDGSFVRVLPGDPDNSYLVHKLEGSATVGGIMPPSGMLGAAEIAAIRQWISDGALR